MTKRELLDLLAETPDNATIRMADGLPVTGVTITTLADDVDVWLNDRDDE